MSRLRVVFRLLASSAAVVMAVAGSPLAASDADTVSMAAALELVHLSRADLALPIDYEAPDEWRLAIVNRIMTDPLSVGETCSDLASAITADSTATSLAIMVRALCPVLDFSMRQGREKAVNSRDAGAGGEPPAAPAVGGVAPPALGPPALQDVLQPLLRALDSGRRHTAAAFAHLSPAERDSLVRWGPRIIEEDVNDPSKTIFELEDEKWEEIALSERILAMAAKIRMAELDSAAIVVSEGLDRALAASRAGIAGIAGLTAQTHDDLGGAAEGDIIASERRPDGTRIVIGGPGPTTYREPFDLIVDLGGDDTYLAGAGGSGAGRFPVSMALDLGGNDRYSCTDPAAIGGGYLGIGMLVDVGGDDVYRAGNFALGAGWYGAGALLDLAGDDRYIGDTAVEGAAHAGIGILSDREGADSYEAAFASQGFGFVGGAGAMDDRSGNDFYLLRPRYTDLIRYEDHFVSLSQGFGYGHRPEKSGGVGLLVEGGGNDLYLSDIFGQGAAYWYALGCLVDRGGNDSYVSHQYAQGAGIHLAGAALVDESGEDRYFARGVSQGCGHDLGVGLLWERGGSDTYDAFDLSQGAGNANGIGLLVDESGEDGYWVKRADNTHGYGNPRREYGSTGLLLDRAGRDHYAGHGADTTAWIGPWFGVGIDVEPTPAVPVAPATAASTAPAALADTSFIPPPTPDGRPYTPETLFILASSLEPRFDAARGWARGEIVRRGAESVPALVAHLGTKDAPDRQTVSDLLKQIGEPAISPLVDSLRSSDWRVIVLACRTLGEIGSPRAVDGLTRATRHENWVIRESAVTALGKIHDPRSLAGLRKTLRDDPSPYVRKSAAFALGEIGGRDAVQPLLAALADERGLVRATARTSLARLDTLAVPALRNAVADDAAGAHRMPARAVALALETLHDLGRGLSGEELRRLVAGGLWGDPEIRSATARMIAAAHDELAPADLHDAELTLADLARDPDPRVRALAIDLMSGRE